MRPGAHGWHLASMACSAVVSLCMQGAAQLPASSVSTRAVLVVAAALASVVYAVLIVALKVHRDSGVSCLGASFAVSNGCAMVCCLVRRPPPVPVAGVCGGTSTYASTPSPPLARQIAVVSSSPDTVQAAQLTWAVYVLMVLATTIKAVRCSHGDVVWWELVHR